MTQNEIREGLNALSDEIRNLILEFEHEYPMTVTYINVRRQDVTPLGGQPSSIPSVEVQSVMEGRAS